MRMNTLVVRSLHNDIGMMRITGIGFSVLLVVVFVLLTWMVATALGYRMSLASSLLVSVGLTLLLTLILNAFTQQ